VGSTSSGTRSGAVTTAPPALPRCITGCALATKRRLRNGKAIRRGTFTSVNALIRRIRAYVEHWNADAEPFAWTATADEILAKVRWVETNVKKLVANNSK
jgi:hypothetical protein